MSILMCPPEYYGVATDDGVDHDSAIRQWETLCRTYDRLGETIELVEAVPGLGRMVFTADAGIVRGRIAVLASFLEGERHGEEEHWGEALSRLGYDVHRIPRDLAFAGGGDALFVGDRLFCGWGFGTHRGSHAIVARAFGVEVHAIHLVDPRFHRLDTCFCPLDRNTVLFAPDALAPESARLLRLTIPHVIEVPPDVAAGFACNVLRVGDYVVGSTSLALLEAPLRVAGYSTVALRMDEFAKTRGGVRCLSLPLG